MAGTPGLYPAFRHRVSLWQIIQLLEGIADFHLLFHPAADDFFELLFKLMLDDEHHRLKPGTLCIINGIVDNNLPVRAYWVDLLQAAVPASHSRRHYH